MDFVFRKTQFVLSFFIVLLCSESSTHGAALRDFRFGTARRADELPCRRPASSPRQPRGVAKRGSSSHLERQALNSLFAGKAVGRRPTDEACAARGARNRGATGRRSKSVSPACEPLLSPAAANPSGREPSRCAPPRSARANPPAIAARLAERIRPQMAPQRLEKVKSAPGNGMAPETPDPQHLVQERDGGLAERPPPVARDECWAPERGTEIFLAVKP